VVSVLRARAGTPERPRDPDGRMPLGEHLRELRGRLGKSIIAIVIAGIAGIIWYNPIIAFLKEPACNLKGIQGVGEGPCSVLKIEGLLNPLSLQIKVGLMVGLLLASPVWMYQLWAFVAPGLHRRERRWTLAFVGVGVPLFALGAAAAYYTLPRGLPFLLGLTPTGVSNSVDLVEYLDIVVRLILIFALAFELPLLLVLLNLAGILSARRLWSWWRIAFMVIFVFTAVATPTGDPITMLLLAIPMCALYLLAAGVATFVDRRRGPEQELFADVADDQASPLETRVGPVEQPEPIDADRPADNEPGPSDPSGPDDESSADRSGSDEGSSPHDEPGNRDDVT
jgi:sec-independent protein translocase protein TatC